MSSIDNGSKPSASGENPLDKIGLGDSGKKFSSVVNLVVHPEFDSKAVYASIATGIEGWIEQAIEIRKTN